MVPWFANPTQITKLSEGSRAVNRIKFWARYLGREKLGTSLGQTEVSGRCYP